MAKKKAPAPPTIDADWISARTRDVVGTPAELSRRIFGHKDLFARVLTGERGLKTGELIAIASALQIPVALLLRKLGHRVPGGECEVVGIVDARSRVQPLPPKPLAVVDCPIDVSHFAELVAVRVDAPKSALALYHGAHLYFAKPETKGVEPGAIGRVSVIQVGEISTPVVGILDRSSLDTASVTLYGTGETIETGKLISATPVRWIKVG